LFAVLLRLFVLACGCGVWLCLRLAWILAYL
jgi:hypothetical protein